MPRRIPLPFKIKGEPKHLGVRVRKELIDGFGISITDAAAALGVGRGALTKLLAGDSHISPTMAIRFEQVFGGRSARNWVNLQGAYHLQMARLRVDFDLERLDKQKA